VERIAGRQRTGLAGAVRTAAAAALPAPSAAVPPRPLSRRAAPSAAVAPRPPPSPPPSVGGAAASPVRVRVAAGHGRCGRRVAAVAEQRPEAAHLVAGRHGQQGHDDHRDGRGRGRDDHPVHPAAATVAAPPATVAAVHRRSGVRPPTAARRARTVVAGRLRAPRTAVPIVLRRSRGRGLSRASFRRRRRWTGVPTVGCPPAPSAPSSPAAAAATTTVALGGRDGRRTVARLVLVRRRIRRGGPARRTGLTRRSDTHT